MNEMKFYRQHYRKLGAPPAESQCLALRTVLLMKLQKELLDTGMTQKEAAKKLGVKQPRISEIHKGSFDKFSAELLVKYLYRLGKEVTITLESQEN